MNGISPATDHLVRSVVGDWGLVSLLGENWENIFSDLYLSKHLPDNEDSRTITDKYNFIEVRAA